MKLVEVPRGRDLEVPRTLSKPKYTKQKRRAMTPSSGSLAFKAAQRQRVMTCIKPQELSLVCWVPYLFYTPKFDVKNERFGRSSIAKTTVQWSW